VLRELWNRITGGTSEAIERETELDELSPAGRTHAEEGIEGYRSDLIAGERSAGLDYSHFDDDV
jgi:hypothetical protein